MSSDPTKSPQNSNINPPSTGGTFVRIEAVHLLIHHNSKIYRKLLAPEPNKRQAQYFKAAGEHFIKTIRLIEDSWIQFEFDFRVVHSVVGSSGNGNLSYMLECSY